MILADTYRTSSGVPGIVWSLAIAGLFAWRGYVAALEAERRNGRSPYGWEPVTWSIICFCTTLFGRLLLAAGANREQNRAPAPFAAAPEWKPPPPPPPPPAPSWPPTPIREAAVESTLPQVAVPLQPPMPAEDQTAPPPTKPSAVNILPNW
jgi:hypothetical protein